MNPKDICDFAYQLDMARIKKAPIEQISHSVSNFSRRDAYSIQESGRDLRKKRGECAIGLKVGLTSEAKRQQMGLSSPLYGVLTDAMQIQANETLSLEKLIHPKGEPELAFLIAKELSGKITREEALEACQEIYPCIEIVDSRYKQFKYFSMEDVISDNSSSSHFALGPAYKDFSGLNLSDLKMTFKVNGDIAAVGNSRAISGDPVLSLVQLCELLAIRNQSIPAGTIVLAGAATAAIDLFSGMTMELETQELQPMALKVE